MKFTLRSSLVAIGVVCLAAAGYWFYAGDSPKASEATPAPDAGPVASVVLAPIKNMKLSNVITAYGNVVPAPGAVRVVSLPYEARVGRIMVSSGQKILRNDALLEIEPSPDTLLQFEKAKNTQAISKQTLDHVKELFGLKLATNAQILKAEESFRQASLQVESLEKRGVDGKRFIRATVRGLVNNVPVREGAIVPAGNPLMEIIAQDRLEVRLGVEPEELRKLASGRSVSLSLVYEPAEKRIVGKIRKVSRTVNPATRLVDVFVSLPGSARFLVGEYIVGRVETQSSFGMTVPRSAVLPEGGENVLYTVRNGRAVKHIVETGIESNGDVQITGDNLSPGDEVVILGNYELRDGMRVKVETTE